tara:strand:+ start:203 stop:451 length:249 start_codon:yes stop_codon:yes gene_type:complete
MYKPFEEFFTELQEKNEYKMSDNYKRLSPKMKKAVDDVFSFMEKNPSDFLTSLETKIKDISKQHKVSHDKLTKYFDNETLNV